MGYQTIFKRYEIKYMLTKEQRDALLQIMAQYMKLDKYGRTIIRNIYFDTSSYRLIRRSLEKPEYKEKLRIRSYKRADDNSTVFVELKKKYKSVVYKRRVAMTEKCAIDWLCTNSYHPENSQIVNEIDYFCSFYDVLRPTVFLSYEREAYYSLADDGFRITFDENILSRQEDLSLESDVWGTPLIDDDRVLMEVKTSGGIPLWLSHFLAENQIYKTSFSKYGTAYNKTILKQWFGGNKYA